MLEKAIKLKADASDLTAKIRTAKEQLKDPGLSKMKRAKLELDITQFRLQRSIAKADLVLLGKTKTKPKLEATKADLDAKIKAGRKALRETHNQKTKPKIEADIKAALEKKRQIDRELRKLERTYTRRPSW